MKNSLLTSLFLLVLSFASGQVVPANNLVPMSSGGGIKYTAFGSPTEYGGLVWNNTGTFYGDGDDFGMYTNGNRDMILATQSGRLFLNTFRVGISTHTPQAKLHIPNGDIIVGGPEGISNTLNATLFIKSRGDNSSTYPVYVGMSGLSGSDLFWIRGEGNGYLRGKFGIGTADPEGLLQVSSESNPSIAIGRSSQNTGGKSTLAFYGGTAAVQNGFFIQYNKDANRDRLDFIDGDGITPRLSILNGGNVGIGTTSPDYKLTVDGNIKCEEVKVQVVPASVPDYVFEKDYDLASLAEVETYINKNKHLPEVPSAGEMGVNGLNLREMNLLLLKKVEELTLHLIEKEKKIMAIERRLEQLEKK